MKKIRAILSAILTAAIILSAVPLVLAEGLSYTAALSVDKSTAVKGGSVKATVEVTSAGGHGVASAELLLTYDPDVLEFDKDGSELPSYCSVTAENGEISVVSFGEEVADNVAFVFAFKVTAADVRTEIKLERAAFSNAANAVSSDLTEATVTADKVSVTVDAESVPVTIDEALFKGPSSVKKGSDYVFTLADDGRFYDYGIITATVGGSPATVTDNGNGSYTVRNVTAPLVITSARTPKTYTVTVSGEVENAPAIATYGTNYVFKLKANTPATDVSGVTYRIKSVKIGGTAYTGYSYSTESRTATIPGNAIKGNIEIVIERTEIPVEQVTVSVDGAVGVIVGDYPTSVVKGSSHTLVLDPVPGYLYTVSAKMNGSDVAVKAEGNRYTVQGITSDIVFTVTATVPMGGLKVYEFLQLDGKMVYLVTNETDKLEGYCYTYEGNKMYWSQTYNAYCYVVITSEPELALGRLDIVTGNAVILEGGTDVDLSGETNENDATLVYGMYNASFSELSSGITVAKLILADVNGDKAINVLDSAAILN